MERFLLIIIAALLAPLSWGQDTWACVEELRLKIEKDEPEQVYTFNVYQQEEFLLRYEPQSNRLAIEGRAWREEGSHYLDCDSCILDSERGPTLLRASGLAQRFTMKDQRFFSTVTTYDTAEMTSGTCIRYEE